MITILLRLLRLLPLLCGARRHVALENLALRHQLTVYKKTVTRPKVRRSDRLFRIALSRVWAGWRQALVIVSPKAVLRWQRRRFCEHWTKLSARPIPGRPPVNAEIKALDFNVTEHPTAHWTAQQIVDAFPDDSAPSYLLRDRDQVYGEQFRHRVKGMRIEEVVTAPHSPWQNPFAERLIGSIRRECLNHVLVLGESHLRRILAPLLLLLSPGSHASRARQGCAGRQARRAPRGRQDRADSRSRWPASPLRPPGGVVQHRRSSLLSNTRHRSSSAAQPTRSPSSIATPV
jgi:hypothetical protein